MNQNRAVRYLANESGTIAVAARYRGKHPEWQRRRTVASVEWYLAHTAPALPPPGLPLIAVADAMWYESEGLRCAVYVILLRPVSGDRAWILPPVIVPGKESWAGWRIAWEEVPTEYRTRIRALVCDGNRFIRAAGNRYGWIVQQCHFHLIARIKNYATGSRWSKRPGRGRVILGLVGEMINTSDEQRLEELEDQVRFVMANLPHRYLCHQLAWFLKHLDEYRAYLTHPELQLPTTTNSAESFIRQLRALLQRSRGFRTQPSLSRWLRAYCLFKVTIACNGKRQPN